MGFSQSLSGVNAASSQLDTIGNNIANSQTVGYKSSSVQFADIFANSQGLGTRVAGKLQDFSTGSLETTGRGLDLAIAGDGFFQFTQNEQLAYSRNGQLSMSADGYFENAQGARLTDQQGQPLQVTQFSQGAQATGGVQTEFRLNPEAEAIDRGTVDFVQSDSDSYSYVTNAGTVYDSLGVAHDMSLYYTKTGENEWEVRAALDGKMAQDVDADGDGELDGTGGEPQTISFNTSGEIPAGDPTAFNFDFGDLGNGSAPLAFDIDFDGTTQYGEFELGNFAQDGNASGTFVGVEITENGEVLANYSNGNSEEVGIVGMANFRNPEGLEPQGDNLWAATQESGAALLGQAGTGQLGSLESGTVEASNVDLTQELVDMIIAQRNFQANNNAIQTQSDILETVTNLR
ncbi:flagellar hook protein FlgE [Chromohalobacter israelensis]|uniref:flagellar hook protein FlgE n=1 Tax=Chromohalobacter israelensis TaxID=141390 RepID=UPI0015C49458|nr:flagellar hook protein FlgE [Chromohalobacter salexigens]MDO0946529.1 flagellar hook protein FlgE [Chromohalobacter salexigens]NWO56729.1 flagellar hook protein FlgE [Chromohalobacter salexigens]